MNVMSRTAAFGSLLSGLVVGSIGLTMPASDPLAMVFVVGGAGLVLFGLILVVALVRRHFRREYTAALDAADPIARWRVSQRDLDAFRRIDAGRRRRLWSLKNFLKLPADVAEGGLPIVIGERSLLVGQKYTSEIETYGTLGEADWHEGDPGFIELGFMLKLSKGETILVLRLPVPDAAREEAAKGLAHLRSLIGPGDRERIHHQYREHFEAAMQSTDAAHPIQRRGRVVLAGVGAFCLVLLGIIFVPRYFGERAPEPSYLLRGRSVVCTVEQTARVNELVQSTRGEFGAYADASFLPSLAERVEATRRAVGGTCAAFVDRAMVDIARGETLPVLRGIVLRDSVNDTLEIDGVVSCSPHECN